MKKVLLALLTIMIAINLVNAQSDWINFKVDDKLSVKLPTHATSIGSGMVAHSKDSLICYVSIVGEMDSTALAKLVSTPDFPDGLKTAMIGTQQGLTLGDMKAGKWNGYNCYNVDGENVSKNLKVSFYIIIIGGRIYAFGAMMPANHDIKEKDIFFNTLKLN